MVAAVGRERLVLDLSCRKRLGPGGESEGYFVVTDRWQNFTDLRVCGGVNRCLNLNIHLSIRLLVPKVYCHRLKPRRSSGWPSTARSSWSTASTSRALCAIAMGFGRTVVLDTEASKSEQPSP